MASKKSARKAARKAMYTPAGKADMGGGGVKVGKGGPKGLFKRGAGGGGGGGKRG